MLYVFGAWRRAFPCPLRSIAHAKSCAVLRCLALLFSNSLNRQSFPSIGNLCLFTRQERPWHRKCCASFLGFYLVRGSWHGSCFVYWQAGILPRFKPKTKMKTNTKKQRLITLSNALALLGFNANEIDTLLSVERGLSRWHELECGTGNDRVSVSVERDEQTGKPFRRVQFQSRSGWVDRREPCRDMEKANLARLARVMAGKTVRAYVQGDPRGCALYILRPKDVPEGGDVNAYYSRGIAVCID